MSRKAIIDEFTDLPASRQRKYQLRRMRDGICAYCGHRKIVSNNRCRTCRLKSAIVAYSNRCLTTGRRNKSKWLDKALPRLTPASPEPPLVGNLPPSENPSTAPAYPKSTNAYPKST